MIAHRVNPAFLKTNWLFSAFLICFFFFISLINRRFGHHELFVGWKARTMRHVRCRWFVPCDSWRKCLKHCRCQDELARFAQDLKERLILKFWQTDWLIKFTLDHLTIQNNYPGWVYNELCLNKCWMVVFLTNSNWRAPVGMCLKVCKWDIYRRQLNEVATVDWQRCHTFPTTFNFNLSWVLCQIQKYTNKKYKHNSWLSHWSSYQGAGMLVLEC